MSAALRAPHQGTPKTLEQAIGQALAAAGGPGYRERIVAIHRDFLAQKFCAAMMEHPECEKVLAELFDRCTKGEKS